MKSQLVLAGILILLGSAVVRAGEPPPDLSTAEGLAKSIRGFILEQLPPVLHEDTHNWGQQKLVTRGVEWKGAGKLLPKGQKSHKNHGVWRKVRVSAVNPAHSLDVQIRDVQRAGPERRTFTTYLAMDLRTEAEQQNWRAGLKTFSGSVRARLRAYLMLSCEVSSKLEACGGLLPDLVIRMRVLKSDVRYDHFVTEHVAGVGGEMAEWLGDAGHGLLKLIKPGLERNLLEKANTAIVKSTDTKEVRIGFGKWFPKQ